MVVVVSAAAMIRVVAVNAFGAVDGVAGRSRDRRFTDRTLLGLCVLKVMYG
jgi:hypothetical protein